MEQTSRIRVDALGQLKKAQQMIEEGRKELAAANRKILIAQRLIDASADALRSPRSGRVAGQSRPR